MTESRECQNCKLQFVIEAGDFDFYKKIGVPPPTWCPECRMKRRFMWRNERNLYRQKCALTGKDIITCFAPDSGIVVYDRDTWWSDQWDPMKFGAEYDFKTTFFAQFKKLLGRVPMPAVFNGNCVRSDYCNHTGESKDCYLSSACWRSENVSYSSRSHLSKDCLDAFGISQSEMCYEVISSVKLYKTAFSENCENCTESAFLFDCKGCSNCFCSTNLRNKQYYIFNEPYSREEYLKKIKEFDVGSYAGLRKIAEKFSELRSKALRKYANVFNVKDVTGDNLSHAYNCKDCFDLVDDSRDCRWCINGGIKMSDVYDGYGVGGDLEIGYEVIDTGKQASQLMFTGIVWASINVRYSLNCFSCENCFGCIGLRGKKYCILNTQYTPEDYKALLPKIVEHMSQMPYADKKRRIYGYGEFFPPEISPFAYNETITQDYFPLAELAATEKGYAWRNFADRKYVPTILSEKLPDQIRDVPDSITKEIIGCAHLGTCDEQCTTAFRIIDAELQFYKRINMALPRLCPNCRHAVRRNRRNPPHLWARTCMCLGKQIANGESPMVYENTVAHFHGDARCPNEFETTYHPGRPETVYCESCYNSEIV